MTSADSGMNWNTIPATTLNINWNGIACSGDFTKLMATVYGSYIRYSISTNGVFGSWQTVDTAGERDWNDITSNEDFTKIVAVVNNGAIYVSEDTGATWSTLSSAGVRSWSCITASSDFSKFAAGTTR